MNPQTAVQPQSCRDGRQNGWWTQDGQGCQAVAKNRRFNRRMKEMHMSKSVIILAHLRLNYFPVRFHPRISG
jgi:hypothetical protein